MQHNQTTGAAAGPSSGVAMTVKVEQAAPMALDTGVAEVIDITAISTLPQHNSCVQPC
ncbi:hypothetical protein CHLRE_02g141026v5 [Chlamydomonas reinhardtii]|uniref:Uncharacterized protein n=1 Tax=Chlamydomonas reinhardtii TaxID=3055 RepID=A0A2K3E449_CHLRE|nr:uncharacterized protein CHLRE_02g141026v5 [Chlamydomonas reinhardtii]PNW87575.1 hypothetical protein CHLRE_02g141026v5 [Chlamydomonas reinhardtii]